MTDAAGGLNIAITDAHTQFAQMAADMATPQNSTECIIQLPNVSAANDVNYDNVQVAQSNDPEVMNSISGAYSLVADTHAVSYQLPGNEKSSEPIANVELEAVEPIPEGSTTPMLSLTAIGDACITVKETLQSQQVLNDEQYMSVPILTPPPVQKHYQDNFEVSGPSPMA